jgi:hypothetical protein
MNALLSYPSLIISNLLSLRKIDPSTRACPSRFAQINTHAMMSPACHLHEPRAPPSLFQFRKSHDLVDAMREDQTMANPYAWLSWARGNRNAVRRPPVERPVACGCFVSAWFKEKFVFALVWLACFGQLDVSQVVRCRCPWHGWIYYWEPDDDWVVSLYLRKRCLMNN